ncbi:MAG: hypothetical protein LBP34_02380 [Flavobacteriaceae bacterium]|nr:hypothetical protein [Flavobacteriaceae bacterium]
MVRKFSYSFLPVFFCSVFISFISVEGIHPYHVGSVEFNYNQKTKTFEITGKFFLDDLENAVNKKYSKKLHFGEAKHKAQMNEALKNYIAEYMKLKTDNRYLKIDYLGFEEDQESVNVYLESEVVETPKKIETSISLLYNLFDDQMNIIHVVINGKRKSFRLSYPEQYFYQQF